MSDLRKKLIRLAHEIPTLRADLLPLLRMDQTARRKTAEGADAIMRVLKKSYQDGLQAAPGWDFEASGDRLDATDLDEIIDEAKQLRARGICNVTDLQELASYLDEVAFMAGVVKGRGSRREAAGRGPTEDRFFTWQSGGKILSYKGPEQDHQTGWHAFASGVASLGDAVRRAKSYAHKFHLSLPLPLYTQEYDESRKGWIYPERTLVR